jgi:hypothetical protein
MNDNLKLNADVQDSAREVLAIVARSLMGAIKGGAEEARMALEAELARQKVAHSFLVERIKQEAVGGLLVELQGQHDDLTTRIEALDGKPQNHPLRLAYQHRLMIVERQQTEVLRALGIDVDAVPALEHRPAEHDAPDAVPVKAHVRRRRQVLNGAAGDTDN